MGNCRQKLLYYLQLVGGLLVERVLRVGLQEQVLEAVHNGVDGEHWTKKKKNKPVTG